MRPLLKRCWIFIVMALCLVPTMAQNASSDGYAEALRRIEEARVSGATELDLSGLGLERLAPEIGSLSVLWRLDLSSNHLTELPPELGNLTNLKALDLSANHLMSLPLELGQLTKIQEFDYDENPLVMPDYLKKNHPYGTIRYLQQQHSTMIYEIVLRTLYVIGSVLVVMIARHYWQQRTFDEKQKRVS